MRLILISASARFMTESAARAGFECVAVDWFNDWDLTKIAQFGLSGRRSVFKIDGFDDLENVLRYHEVADSDGAAGKSIEACDTVFAMIGGGCENHVEVVLQIERRFALLGPSSESLTRLHDTNSIFEIASLIEQVGGRFPTTRLSHPTEPALQMSEIWLRKNWRSAGGKHVEIVNTTNEAVEASDSGVPLNSDTSIIYQLRISGNLRSVVYLAEKDACHVLCVTEQLIGEPNFGAATFSYCGSIGPVSVSSGNHESMRQIGIAIAGHFQIKGLFGIDFVVNESGVWVIDINLRMTASAEVHELSRRLDARDKEYSIVADHVAACRGERSALTFQTPSPSSELNRMIGKAILFCRSASGILIDEVSFQAIKNWYRPLSNAWVADIPQVGTNIELGQPILSLFVTGGDAVSVKEKLFEFARLLSALIGDVTIGKTNSFNG